MSSDLATDVTHIDDIEEEEEEEVEYFSPWPCQKLWLNSDRSVHGSQQVFMCLTHNRAVAREVVSSY